MSRRVWASGLIRPDPRTKFALILICVIAATIAPSLKYELLVVAAVAVFGALIGKWRSALTGLAAYALIYALTLWTVGNVSGLARGFLMAFFGILHKVYPCGMIAGLVIRTTRVNEFLAAMNRSRVPKKIVIPIAVMLRYLPAIREDWVSIHDAMLYNYEMCQGRWDVAFKIHLPPEHRSLGQGTVVQGRENGGHNAQVQTRILHAQPAAHLGVHVHLTQIDLQIITV